MPSSTLRPILGSATPKVVLLTGDIVLGSSGALSSQACDGFLVGTRSAAGRYPVTLRQKYRKLRGVRATVKISGTSAYTAAKSTGECIVRNWDAAAGTFTLQLVRTDTLADADAADNATVGLTIELVL